MLFGNKEEIFDCTVLETINVFESGSKVTLQLLDDYLKVNGDQKKQWILYYQHIVECKNEENIVTITYTNSLKEKRYFKIQENNNKGKKLVKLLAKK